MKSVAEPPAHSLSPGRLRADGGLAISVLLSSFSTSSANVALPSLVEGFAASLAQVQWVLLSYLAAVTLLVVPAGVAGDRWGRKRVFEIGLLVFAAASGLCAMAIDLRWLIAARFLQGLGGAVMLALAMAAARGPRAGRTMGLLGTMSAVGTAAGPALGGMLLAAAGWRGIFVVNVPLALVALFLVRRHLADDAAETDSLAATALSFGAMVGRAGKHAARLVMTFLAAAVVMGTLVIGPFYLTQTLGLSAAWVGLVVSIGPVVAALSGVPAGRLVDRLGAERVAGGGLLAVTAGALGLAMLPVSLGVSGYALAVAVVTAGYAFFQTANNATVMARAGAEQRGLVSGLLNFSRNLGLMAGTAVIGAVFWHASQQGGGEGTAEAVAAAMHVSFAIAAAVAGGALLIALRTVPRSRDDAGSAEPVGKVRTA